MSYHRFATLINIELADVIELWSITKYDKDEKRMSIVLSAKVVFQRFQAAFKRHSFVGSILVYSCLYGGGDIARQTVQRTPKKDYVTTARMAVVGGGGLAPCLYMWYRVLDRLVSGTTLQVVVKKVVIDQMVAGPVGIFIFYVGQFKKMKRNY